MATTLDDAVIRLRLDVTEAKRDAKKIQDERDAATGAEPSKEPSPADPIKLPPVGTPPQPGRPGPGDGGSDRPKPGLGPREEREETVRRSRRNQRRIRRANARQGVSTVATILASIPFVEAFGIGLGGAMLVNQFGPGVAGGMASRLSAGDSQVEAAFKASLEATNEQVENLSAIVGEVQAFLGAITAAKGFLGAQAQTAALTADDPTKVDLTKLAPTFLPFLRVQFALQGLQKRKEFLQREALGAAVGANLPELLKMGLSK